MAVYLTLTDNLNRLFVDIRGCKPMSKSEEESAFIRVANGDENAVAEIVKANMLFVVNRAKMFSRSNDRVEDFIQAGAMGMVDAIKRFDITKGTKFISFAVDYIDLYIRKAIDELNIVRQSNDKKIAPKVRKIRTKFLQENGREATEWEIKDILETEYGLEVKDIRDITAMSISHLDQEVGEEDCTALDCGEIATRTSSINSVEREVENEDNTHKCKVLMQRLTEKEQKVINYCFGLNGCEEMFEEDIAEMMGYTPERIRQIKVGAIKKMRG